MSSNNHHYSKLESIEDGDSESGLNHGQPVKPYRRRLTSPKSWINHFNPLTIVLLLTNLIFIFLWLDKSISSTSQGCIRPQLSFSTAQASNAITYVRKRLWRSLENNPFTGSPRPEFDEAWKHIIEPLTTLILPSEYSSDDLGASTIALADGSGYIGELSVYHELHCIKRIRHWLSPEVYHVNISAYDHRLEAIHIDHCLEYWREAAMCRADSTLATFFWRDGVPTSRVYADHECVDWNVFDKWARSRMLVLKDMNDLDQTDRWKYIRTADGKTAFRDRPDVEAHP